MNRRPDLILARFFGHILQSLEDCKQALQAQTISVAELHTSSRQKQHELGEQARRGEEFGLDRPDAMDAAGATGLEQGSVQVRSFSRPARRLEKAHLASCSSFIPSLGPLDPLTQNSTFHHVP